MTRSKRNKEPRSSYRRRVHGDEPREAGPLVDTLHRSQIPNYNSVVVRRFKFRLRFNNGLTTAYPITTASLLGLYAMARGGTASPLSLFSNMRVRSVELWQPNLVGDVGTVPEVDVILEFASSTIAGFGGGPRITHTATVGTSAKYAYLKAVPRKTELASQWFSSTQTSYDLWNMQVGIDCIMDLTVDAVFINGEAPVTIPQTSSAAAGKPW